MSADPPELKIADYGMGNLRSVAKAFEHVGVDGLVSADPAELGAAQAIVLPGVGAFPEAMRRDRPPRPRRGRSASAPPPGCPLLGICLGMQLLFDSSTEHGGAGGLGLLAGTVEALRAPELKLPHIGWAHLHLDSASPLTGGIAAGEPFYFVHSFAARPDPEDLIASADYGERFAAVVGRGSVFGTQFHPEKSSRAGLRMLRNFAALAPLPARRPERRRRC